MEMHGTAEESGVAPSLLGAGDTSTLLDGRRPSLRSTGSGRKKLQASSLIEISEESPPPVQSLPSLRKLAYMYLGDWLLILALMVVLVMLEMIHPYQRFVDANFLLYVGYPHRATDTVPSLWVPVLGVAVPLLAICLDYLRHKRGVELHQSILALLMAVLLNGDVTDGLKVALGRPRPDFMRRCFPDGVQRFAENGNVLCTGDPRTIIEGRKSFPSGHTSWSCCGLGFLSLYIAGRLGLLSLGIGNNSNRISSSRAMLPVVVAALPFCGAVAVGISRIDDYRHHWTDVVTGGCIGLFFAVTMYFRYLGPLLLLDDASGEGLRGIEASKGAGHQVVDIEARAP